MSPNKMNSQVSSKVSHFQKLMYDVRTMFVIVEKIISLASFDVRLAYAGTSVVFSYLIFGNNP